MSAASEEGPTTSHSLNSDVLRSFPLTDSTSSRRQYWARPLRHFFQRKEQRHRVG
jgi:hypothetical protein